MTVSRNLSSVCEALVKMLHLWQEATKRASSTLTLDFLSVAVGVFEDAFSSNEGVRWKLYLQATV